MSKTPPSRLLSLSVKGLQRIENLHRERDFAFVIGDERYFCPSLIAEFLSPRVSSLRSQDITIQELYLETDDPNHLFSSLLSIGFGGEFSLKEDDVPFVRSLCRELWNCELFENTFDDREDQIEETELTARLKFISGIENGLDVGIIASHFHELSVSALDDLTPSTIATILSAPNLVLLNEDSLFETIHRQACRDLSYFGLLEFVRFEFVSDHCMERVFEFISSHFEEITIGIWSSLGTRLRLPVTPSGHEDRFYGPKVESKIVSSLPSIFRFFGDKQFRLLYRGSRDGFERSAFHGRCDGHSDTMTLILSDNDNIFDGYTPLTWSSANQWLSDSSLRSFIFTIKNPHGLSPMIFSQKKSDCAVLAASSYGPLFGSADLRVWDNSQTSQSCYSNVGNTYNNDTGLSGEVVLTGAKYFVLKEIEVFELTGAK
jgi:hypothetical protein